MQYEGPVESDRETISQLVKEGSDVPGVIKAVLSAIFLHDTQFAGDMLLRGLSVVKGDERMSLLRMMQTFTQVHEHIDLHSDFIRELDGNAGVSESLSPEVLEIRNMLCELRAIFSNSD